MIEPEGKAIASTEENRMDEYVTAVSDFVHSQAESQLVQGYQFFKVLTNTQ